MYMYYIHIHVDVDGVVMRGVPLSVWMLVCYIHVHLNREWSDLRWACVSGVVYTVWVGSPYRIADFKLCNNTWQDGSQHTQVLLSGTGSKLCTCSMQCS